MPPDAAGSQRIVVAGTPEPTPPAHPVPEPRLPRETRYARAASARTRVMHHTGWTTRRLTIAGGLGAGATLLGGLVFTAKFGDGAGESPLLAMGFGLFVIGMVVFCAALVALLATGIGILSERRGWAPACGVVLGPPALLWLLHLAGAVGYAVPAVISLVLIGGIVVALR